MFKVICACRTSTLRRRCLALLLNPVNNIILSRIQCVQVLDKFLNHRRTYVATQNVPVKEESISVGKEMISAVKIPKRSELGTLTEKNMEAFNLESWIFRWKIFEKRMQKVKMHEGIEYLYDDICDQIDVTEFFAEFGLPDTFNSWFMVIELHIYLFSCRFMKHEDEYFKVLMRDILIELFWWDVKLRTEKLTKPMLSLKVRKKTMIQLDAQFQAAFYGYDEGLQSNDMVLAAAFWRRFYARECYDAVVLERLVKYMRVQLEYLSELSVDDILYRNRPIVIPLYEIIVP